MSFQDGTWINYNTLRVSQAELRDSTREVVSESGSEIFVKFIRISGVGLEIIPVGGDVKFTTGPEGTPAPDASGGAVISDGNKEVLNEVPAGGPVHSVALVADDTENPPSHVLLKFYRQLESLGEFEDDRYTPDGAADDESSVSRSDSSSSQSVSSTSESSLSSGSVSSSSVSHSSSSSSSFTVQISSQSSIGGPDFQ